MKSTTPLLVAYLLFFLAAFTSTEDAKGQNGPLIKCDSQDDCWGKNAHCENGVCSCSYGFTMSFGDCFLEEDYEYIDKFNKQTVENTDKIGDSVNGQNKPTVLPS